VRYDLGFYIPDDGILRSQRRENIQFYFLRVIIADCFQLIVESVVQNLKSREYVESFADAIIFVPVTPTDL
jgi:hypothetical protein